jgi:hypothetical protein
VIPIDGDHQFQLMATTSHNAYRLKLDGPSIRKTKAANAEAAILFEVKKIENKPYGRPSRPN